MRQPQFLLSLGASLLALVVAFDLSGIAVIALSAVCLVATSQLVRHHDAFGTARVGAVLALTGGVLAVAGWQESLSGWLDLAGLVLIVTGSCTGLRELLPEGSRREAAGRVSGTFLLIALVVALARALDQAGAGPTWVPDTLIPLGAVLVLVAQWFAAYAALAPVSDTADRTA